MLNDDAERLVPLTRAELPDATTVAPARRLFQEVIEPAMAGHPIALEAPRAIKEAYIRAFAEPPELLWASILKEEIQKAQRGIIEAARANSVPPPPNTGNVGWSVDVTKTAKGEQAYPRMPRHARLALKPIRTFELHGNVTVEVEAWHNGQLIARGFVDGTFGDIPPLVIGTTPAEHAVGVLLRALLRVVELGGGSLPEYVIDSDLIAFLIERAGFDGGGGARGRLSGPSLFRLLADPSALAEEVEAFGIRHTESLSDDDARRAEARYRAVAAGIRERADRRRD